MTMHFHIKHHFAKVRYFKACAVQIPERFCIFLLKELYPPQPSWGAYLDNPTRFTIECWVFASFISEDIS